MKPLALILMTTLAQAQWESLPPLPEPAGGFAAGCVNGKIIVTGGTNWRDGTKRWLDTVWQFDPATAQWTHGPSLPHPLAYGAFASDGARLYIAGGADGKQGRREVYALDADMKLKHLADLPQPLAFAAAVVDQGRLQVFGGTPDPDDWSKVTTNLVQVDLAAGTAAAGAALKGLSHGLGLPAMTSVSGGWLTFTGAWFDAEKQVHNSDAAFAYDSKSAAWKKLAAYPISSRGAVAVLLDDDHVYLAGGYGSDEQGFLTQAYIYEIKADRYVPAKPQPFAATSCLVKCGDHIYLLGGEDQKKHRTAACFRIRVSELLSGK